MAINIGDKISLSDAVPSIDYKYGPYGTKELAVQKLGMNGLDVICKGLTVGIRENGKVVEYWFLQGLESVDDLVLKAQQPLIIDGGKAPTISQSTGGIQ